MKSHFHFFKTLIFLLLRLIFAMFIFASLRPSCSRKSSFCKVVSASIRPSPQGSWKSSFCKVISASSQVIKQSETQVLQSYFRKSQAVGKAIFAKFILQVVGPRAVEKASFEMLFPQVTGPQQSKKQFLQS